MGFESSDPLPDRKIYWPETIVRAAVAAGLLTAEQAAAALVEMERITEHNDQQIMAKPWWSRSRGSPRR